MWEILIKSLKILPEKIRQNEVDFALNSKNVNKVPRIFSNFQFLREFILFLEKCENFQWSHWKKNAIKIRQNEVDFALNSKNVNKISRIFSNFQFFSWILKFFGRIFLEKRENFHFRKMTKNSSKCSGLYAKAQERKQSFPTFFSTFQIC